MNKVFFISDFFYSDGYLGGAERCDNVLIEEFFNKKFNNYKSHTFIKLNSDKLSKEVIDKNKDAVFFISNFMLLQESVKEYLIENDVGYIIIEHDHKYLKSNDPSVYDNYLSNEEGLQNIKFYKNAKFVLCQSTLHAQIIHKNLLLNNLVNLKGNLWSEEDINLLQHKLDNSLELSKRPNLWSILNTNNPNKGVSTAVEYCVRNNIKYNQIGSNSYSDFLSQISMSKGVVFFPKWVETFNRFCVEARVLGCKVKTSQKVGASSDGWLNLKGQALLDKIKNEKNRIFNLYSKIINKENLQTFNHSLPRVSIMTTFVDGERYLQGFLEHIERQTIFNEIDLFMYEASCRGKRSKIIENYQKKYSNIHYMSSKDRISASEAFNIIIEKNKNQFMGLISIDDRPAPHYAKKLRKYLSFSDSDLVYGDCVQTTKQNDIVDDFFYKSENLYEHSLNDFSKENMIKCLPGPMPMFKVSMIEKNGNFNTNFKHANDWELWLRCVRGGSKFLKVHDKVGLYYLNPDGVTTSPKNFKTKIKEEATLFMEYRDIIGEKNFKKYKNYFSQGLRSTNEK